MPPLPPNLGQLLLLLAGAAALAVGGGLSLWRLRRETPALRVSAKACAVVGLALGVGVLLWHAGARGSWLPLEDNFEALVWLGLLLAAFVLYVQQTRPIGGLEGFTLPIAALLLIAAAVFGRARPDGYGRAVGGGAQSSWLWVHLLSTYAGALAFAVAAAVGTLYLVASNRLRPGHGRPAPASPPVVPTAAVPLNSPAPRGGALRLGSLERLERVTQTAVTLGFALLTLGLVTGMVKLLHDPAHTSLGPRPLTSPKVVLGFAVWVVYALALHTPMNPSVRGRKAAVLSVVGFVLMFGTIVAVQFVPGGAK